jgi:hypothetical protein
MSLSHAVVTATARDNRTTAAMVAGSAVNKRRAASPRRVESRRSVGLVVASKEVRRGVRTSRLVASPSVSTSTRRAPDERAVPLS